MVYEKDDSITIIVRLTDQELILGRTRLEDLLTPSVKSIQLNDPVALYEYINEDDSSSYGICKISPMIDDDYITLFKSTIAYTASPTPEVMETYIGFIDTKHIRSQQSAPTENDLKGNVVQLISKKKV